MFSRRTIVPPHRRRLECEVLGDRLVPTTLTLSFVLPDGTVGSGSFTLPVDQVNASVERQQIPIDDLTIQVSDATLTSANSLIQTKADFYHGSLLGFFGVWEPYGADIQTVDVEDTALQLTRNVPNPGTGEVAAVAIKPAQVIADFANITTGRAYQMRVLVYADSPTGNTITTDFTVTVNANNTPSDIRDAVNSALTQAGCFANSIGGTRLGIGGTTDKPASMVEIELLSRTPDGRLVVDNTLGGPSYVTDVDGVQLFVNGVLQNPR